MKKFKICVETGPTGNDHYYVVIVADTLDDAIDIAKADHKRHHSNWPAMVSPEACSELADRPKPAFKKGELLAAMLVFATNAHAGQYDKGGLPYILHPLKVMHYLKTDDEELQCIALGHDVIEDTKATYKELRDIGMTERIILGIRGLTKLPGQTPEEYKQGVFENVDSMKVKLADLRHNTDIRRLKGITDKDIARMAKYHLFYTEIEAKLG